MQRFLVGSQDTSHLKIIPVLGYSNKCVISAMTSRGGNRGGTGPRAACSPSAASSPVPIASNAKLAGRACGLFQLQSAPRLTGRGLRAALCAARTDVAPSAKRSIAVPWRERPPDLAGSAITPAATAEVAHATLSLSQSEPANSSMRPAQSARRAQSAPCLHRPSHSIVRLAVARSRRSALLRPRVRAAGGLDRPVREPLESNYRRPRVNLLTNARPRRYCRILFDGCGPQPPSHRPM
jgi:hypothetical protein